jgi:hypothetical protein
MTRSCQFLLSAFVYIIILATAEKYVSQPVEFAIKMQTPAFTIAWQVGDWRAKVSFTGKKHDNSNDIIDS